MYHVYDISCSLCTQSTAFVETALQMALQSPVVYHLLQKVYSVFEQGKLKGQQPHKLTGAGLQKALQGKYSAKLQHFKMFQGLKVSKNFSHVIM